jgi:hypothetical protein
MYGDSRSQSRERVSCQRLPFWPVNGKDGDSSFMALDPCSLHSIYAMRQQGMDARNGRCFRYGRSEECIRERMETLLDR